MVLIASVLGHCLYSAFCNLSNEGLIWVLIALVPGLCMYLTFQHA